MGKQRYVKASGTVILRVMVSEGANPGRNYGCAKNYPNAGLILHVLKACDA